MFTNFFHCETFLVFLLRGISFELVIYIFQGFLSSNLNGLHSPLKQILPQHTCKSRIGMNGTTSVPKSVCRYECG